MPKIHIYSKDLAVRCPTCKVDKRVASSDPNRNTDPNEATCIACLKYYAFSYKNEDALDRYLELKF